MNLKRIFLTAALALAVLATPAAAEMGADVGVILGLKQMDISELDSSSLGDAEDHTQYGVSAFFGNTDWPIMIATDLRFSEGDASASYTYSYTRGGSYTFTYDLEIETTELQVGVAKFWGESIRPYVGGGLAYVQLDATLVGDAFASLPARGLGGPITILDDDDSDFGYYLNGGVAFNVGTNFSIGLDVRYSDAEAELSAESIVRGGTSTSEKFDSGGIQYGARFSYRW